MQISGCDLIFLVEGFVCGLPEEKNSQEVPISQTESYLLPVRGLGLQ